MNDRVFSYVKGWNRVMWNWNAHFSVTAKAVRCYYELEKAVIFTHKIILSIEIMELSEFSNDSLLLIICHPVSRCSKSLWYMYHSYCQPKHKSGESKGHRYTYCSFWQLNFISTSMLPHPDKKKTATDVSGAMGAIDVSLSGLNQVEGQRMLFPYLKPELLAFIANALVHFSKNEHTCACSDTSCITIICPVRVYLLGHKSEYCQSNPCPCWIKGCQWCIS